MNKAALVAGIGSILFIWGGIDDVRAELRPGAITVTPWVGGHLFEGNEDLENDTMLGIGLGIDLSRQFGLEGVFNQVRTHDQGQARDVDVSSYRLDGLFYIRPSSRLAPYLAAGLGTMIHNPDGAGSDSRVLVNYGAGLKYFLSDSLALRGDVRHMLTFDSHHNNLSYAVGLTYHFGGSRPTSQATTEIKEPEPVLPVAVLIPEPPAALPVEPQRTCIELEIRFDFDRAEIKREYHEELSKIAAVMTADSTVTATIKGHTDAIGSEEYNLSLSEKRAERVKRYLVENFAVESDQIRTIGHGKNRPIASNETESGRGLNRRAAGDFCTFEIEFEFAEGADQETPSRASGSTDSTESGKEI